MSSERSSAIADDDEWGTLRRVYALARRSVSDRIVVDAEIERRLAIIVLMTYCAEQSVSTAVCDVDETAVAWRCVEGLMAKTTTATVRV